MVACVQEICTRFRGGQVALRYRLVPPRTCWLRDDRYVLDSGGEPDIRGRQLVGLERSRSLGWSGVA